MHFPQKIYKLRKTNTFFSHFERMRGGKNQIFRILEGSAIEEIHKWWNFESDIICSQKFSFISIDYRPIENERENVYLKFLLMKSSKKYVIFSSACYLIVWFMISSKSFEKKGILKIWQQVFLWGVKIHFGKLPLK